MLQAGTATLQMNDKQLTAAIKNATTVERLAQLANIHSSTLNAIHVAAILTKLANITKKGPMPLHGGPGQRAPATEQAARTLQARDQLLQQLEQLLLSQKCHGQRPRGLANIIWAVAKLECCRNLELLRMLLECFSSQLPAAVPQDIANVLWGVAQLTRDLGIASHSSGQPIAASGGPSGPAELQQIQQQQQQPRPSIATAQSSAQQAGTEGVVAAGSSIVKEQPAGFLQAQQQQLSEQRQQHPAQPEHAEKQQQQQEQQLQQPLHEVGAAASAAGTTPAAAVQQVAAAAASSSAGSAVPLLMEPLLTVPQVQQMLHQLCNMLPMAASQTISNVAWALTVLQQCHNWCMCCCLLELQLLVTTFANNMRDALPGHIQRVVRCTTQLSTACSNHASKDWLEWQPPLLQSMLSHLMMQRKALMQYHVASVLKDLTQMGFIHLPPNVAAEATQAAAKAATAAAEATETATKAAAVAAEAADTGQLGQPAAIGAPGAAAEPVGEQQHSEVAVVASQLAAAAVNLMPGAGKEEKEQQHRQDNDEPPRSPTAAFVHGVVSGMFQRLLLSDLPATATASSTSSAAAPSAQGLFGTRGLGSWAEEVDYAEADAEAAAEAAAKWHGSEGADSGIGNDDDVGSDQDEDDAFAAAEGSDVAGDAKLNSSKAAASSAAYSDAILVRVLPQLDKLGLLQQYRALRNMYPQGNQQHFRPVVCHTCKVDYGPTYHSSLPSVQSIQRGMGPQFAGSHQRGSGQAAPMRGAGSYTSRVMTPYPQPRPVGPSVIMMPGPGPIGMLPHMMPKHGGMASPPPPYGPIYGGRPVMLMTSAPVQHMPHHTPHQQQQYRPPQQQRRGPLARQAQSQHQQQQQLAQLPPPPPQQPQASQKTALPASGPARPFSSFNTPLAVAVGSRKSLDIPSAGPAGAAPDGNNVPHSPFQTAATLADTAKGPGATAASSSSISAGPITSTSGTQPTLTTSSLSTVTIPTPSSMSSTASAFGAPRVCVLSTPGADGTASGPVGRAGARYGQPYRADRAKVVGSSSYLGTQLEEQELQPCLQPAKEHSSSSRAVSGGGFQSQQQQQQPAAGIVAATSRAAAYLGQQTQRMQSSAAATANNMLAGSIAAVGAATGGASGGVGAQAYGTGSSVSAESSLRRMPTRTSSTGSAGLGGFGEGYLQGPGLAVAYVASPRACVAVVPVSSAGLGGMGLSSGLSAGAAVAELHPAAAAAADPPGLAPSTSLLLQQQQPQLGGPGAPVLGQGQAVSGQVEFAGGGMYVVQTSQGVEPQQIQFVQDGQQQLQVAAELSILYLQQPNGESKAYQQRADGSLIPLTQPLQQQLPRQLVHPQQAPMAASTGTVQLQPVQSVHQQGPPQLQQQLVMVESTPAAAGYNLQEQQSIGSISSLGYVQQAQQQPPMQLQQVVQQAPGQYVAGAVPGNLSGGTNVTTQAGGSTAMYYDPSTGQTYTFAPQQAQQLQPQQVHVQDVHHHQLGGGFAGNVGEPSAGSINASHVSPGVEYQVGCAGSNIVGPIESMLQPQQQQQIVLDTPSAGTGLQRMSYSILGAESQQVQPMFMQQQQRQQQQLLEHGAFGGQMLGASAAGVQYVQGLQQVGARGQSYMGVGGAVSARCMQGLVVDTGSMAAGQLVDLQQQQQQQLLLQQHQQQGLPPPPQQQQQQQFYIQPRFQ